MKRQCRHCRSTTNADAPSCDACGCVFAEVPPKLTGVSFGLRSIIAVTLGLLGGVILEVFSR